MQRVFDGIQPVGELKTHGWDFGIGTFDALDGEMIVLDGTVYQAKADGHIYRVSDNLTTPFATVTYFDRDRTETTEKPMNFSIFSTSMARELPSQNMVYAVRMQGSFPLMKVRSISAQQVPYPPLTEAAQNQSVYTYTNTTGSVVGFYTPVFFEGLNVVGFHLHFISDDQKTGGHILDFTVRKNTGLTYGAKAATGEDLLDKAVKLTPNAPIAHIERGNGLLLLYAGKSEDDAAAAYEKASKLKPRDAMEKLDVEFAKSQLED